MVVLRARPFGRELEVICQRRAVEQVCRDLLTETERERYAKIDA